MPPAAVQRRSAIPGAAGQNPRKHGNIAVDGGSHETESLSRVEVEHRGVIEEVVLLITRAEVQQHGRRNRVVVVRALHMRVDERAAIGCDLGRQAFRLAVDRRERRVGVGEGPIERKVLLAR